MEKRLPGADACQLFLRFSASFMETTVSLSALWRAVACSGERWLSAALQEETLDVPVADGGLVWQWTPQATIKPFVHDPAYLGTRCLIVQVTSVDADTSKKMFGEWSDRTASSSLEAK